MARKKRPAAPPADAIVDALFASPPVNESDLSHRLRGVDRPTARRRVVDRLLAAAVSDREAALAMGALVVLGVGAEAPRLTALLLARDAPHRARLAALAALTSGAPEVLHTTLAALDRDDAVELACLPVIDLVAEIKADPGAAARVTEGLLGVPPDARRAVFHSLEDARARVGLRAVDVWTHALGHPEVVAEPDVRDPVLEALVREADADAAALLVRLRDAAPAAARSAFQGALLRLGTARIEGRGPAPLAVAPTALAGTPDGQGALVVLLTMPNPDGSATVADLCFRVSEDVRDGFVLPRVDAPEADDLAAQLAASTHAAFTPAPAPEVLALVDEAVARTLALGRRLSPDAAQTVALLDRLPRAPLPALPAPATRKVTRAEVRRLLEAAHHDAWFFDMGDLASHGVAPPPRAGPSDAWSKRTLAVLAATPVRPRTVAMAEYMARWTAWRGDAAGAARWAALAAGLRADFAASPLARAMLDAFFAPRARPAPGEPDDATGRRTLKQVYFSEVTDPRGADVARLDLAEALRVAVARASELLSGVDQPREHELDALAVAVADVFVKDLAASRRASDRAFARRVAAAMDGAAQLTARARDVLLEVAFDAVGDFMDSVCSACAVRCLDRLGARMPDVFFSDVHPSEQRP